jgi:hypothetical protein
VRISNEKRGAADKVLRKLKVLLRELDLDGDASLESYQNGREQGHALQFWSKSGPLKTRWIAWSENRNSDDIVVYHTDKGDPMQGLSDDAYANARYFRYDAELEAATYVVWLMAHAGGKP